MKAWYLSKTLWINLIAVASLMVPAVGAYVASHPSAVVDGLGAINVLLRLLSSDKLSIS